MTESSFPTEFAPGNQPAAESNRRAAGGDDLGDAAADVGNSPSDGTDLGNRARRMLDQLRDELLAARTPDGHWVGELSSSALSTATAVSALSAVLIHNRDELGADEAEQIESMVVRGMGYLAGQARDDGGFGDTDRSHSNIATSYLVQAADRLADRAVAQSSGSLARIERGKLAAYLKSAGEIDGLRRRYGKDKTFVVPILTNLAIAGLVDWTRVLPLPFELAAVPQAFYRWVRMPVVSYAVPALVAIGQVRHRHQPSRWPPLRWLRSGLVPRTMRVLAKMQPSSGGYLEATPLTSFVLMSLAASDRGRHPVARRAAKFLQDSIREDGSWPIDTNLATWVTSLSIEALAADPNDDGAWATESLDRWHGECQTVGRHPFTGAAPGGWGWTDLSGSVPDGDDTPAAIIATGLLSANRVSDERKPGVLSAATRIQRGADWLAGLQNRDGGYPTFCRGWGQLPFDRSSVDLTAHALRALATGQADEHPIANKDPIASQDPIANRDPIANQDSVAGDPGSQAVVGANDLAAARDFLVRSQQPDGSWLPLWFGNQDRAEEDNPVYGTSRVLVAAASMPPEVVFRGANYLIEHQNSDGGWGGGPSVEKHFGDAGQTSGMEETALAVEALVVVDRQIASAGEARQLVDEPWATAARRRAIILGVENLIRAAERGQHHTAWPIGFYFAKLWYYEKLYPLIYTVRALGHFLAHPPPPLIPTPDRKLAASDRTFDASDRNP